jgi:hypothetical protein
VADATDGRGRSHGRRLIVDTKRVRQRLGAAQVAELAELLEDAPRRAGVIDEVLDAAADGRGMTLVLAEAPTGRTADRDAARRRRR